MNKKLNITGEEYKHRIRQQSKARTMQFRAEQEKRGYKNLTVFLSEPFRAELDKLLDEKGLNRQDAMDYIFGVYQRNISSNVTSNVILDSDKTVNNPVNTGTEDKPAVEAPEKPIQETQTEIPGPGPDKSDRESILEIMDEAHRAGVTWPGIAETLNKRGKLTARGKQWTGPNAQAFYSRNK